MEAPQKNIDFASILLPRRFALLLLALVALQYPDVFLGLKTFFFRDYGFFGYPLAAYHRESFWRGEIPLWNPYNNAGLPFLAQWNTIVLYPGSLIYLLLPLPWSLGIFCLAHQYFAGLGMYFLGRASTKSDLGGAVAAVAFAFGGMLLCSLKWPNNIAAFGWMPWVVLSVFSSRSIGVAALVGGMQMLTGAPEVIFLTWVIVGVIAAAESIAQKSIKPLLRLTGIIALVSMIAAAQLLPFLDLLGHSQRNVRFGGSDWAMPWWGWANFFVPLFGTFPSYHGVPAQPNQYWTSTYFIPLGALALATTAISKGWRPRLLGALAIFGALIALGDVGLVYKALRTAVPSLGFMRFPIKFVVLPIFLIPWLAAYGVAAMPSRKFFISVGIAFSVICLGLAIAPSPFTPTQPSSAIWMNAVLRPILLGGFLFALFRFRQSLPVLLLLILWADGRLQSAELNPRAPEWVFDRDVLKLQKAPTLGHGRAMLDATATEKLDHLLFDTPEEDITATRLSLYCNANLINDIPKVDGFYSLYVREPAQLIDRMYSDTNIVYPALEKLLAVSQKNVPGKTRDWEQVSVDGLWITSGQRVEGFSDSEILNRLFASDFDPEKTVYVSASDKGKLDPSHKVTLSELNWEPQKISFRAKGGPGLVLISQAFHPNWRATINHQAADVIRADYAFTAIEVPAGDSEIELKFVDPKFRFGCALSLLGLLLSAGIISRAR